MPPTILLSFIDDFSTRPWPFTLALLLLLFFASATSMLIIHPIRGPYNSLSAHFPQSFFYPIMAKLRLDFSISIIWTSNKISLKKSLLPFLFLYRLFITKQPELSLFIRSCQFPGQNSLLGYHHIQTKIQTHYYSLEKAYVLIVPISSSPFWPTHCSNHRDLLPVSWTHQDHPFSVSLLACPSPGTVFLDLHLTGIL